MTNLSENNNFLSKKIPKKQDGEHKSPKKSGQDLDQARKIPQRVRNGGRDQKKEEAPDRCAYEPQIE